MASYRLLQSHSKRLLENHSGYLLESDSVFTAPRRACVDAFRTAGPLPNVVNHVLAVPRMEKLSAAPTRRQAIYFAGGNGNELSWYGGGTDTNPNEVNQVVLDATDRLVYRRRVVSLPTDWTWGDDEMQTRVDDLLAYAEANYRFAPPYHLIAVSMGNCCAFNWAINNLDKVRSISGMLPACDMQAMVDDGTLDPYPPPAIYPPDNAVAYGVRPPDDHNPASYAADLSGVPIKLWYSNNDQVVVPATVTAFAADSGAETVNIGNQSGGALPGHGLNIGFTYSQVGDWLITND